MRGTRHDPQSVAAVKRYAATSEEEEKVTACEANRAAGRCLQFFDLARRFGFRPSWEKLVISPQGPRR